MQNKMFISSRAKLNQTIGKRSEFQLELAYAATKSQLKLELRTRFS
jgi:hypothetical protein